MTSSAPGQFWAVGVGPGDSQLLTLKAIDVLQRADIVYHAGPRPDRGRALDVVRHLLRLDQELRQVLTTSMQEATESGGATAYRHAVEEIAAACRAGQTVVMITEGDPTLYSSASYVWEQLDEVAPDVPIEVIPGVTSITAAAARLRWPLARKREMFAVVPAGYYPDLLPPLMEQFPGLCLLKPGGSLTAIREAVAAFGLARQAAYVENLGTPAERVFSDLSLVSDESPYFALVLVRQTPASGGRKPPEESDAHNQHRASQGAYAPCSPTLHVVGLGPGDLRLLTPQALEVLRWADVVVGYQSYLDWLKPLGLRAEMHGSPIGAETERARLALDLAASGRRVALVSSGDAGVYGMASLLLEIAQDRPDLDVAIVPGVTAATAAAALLGAPLGHDFACVSLSDLLTPWEVIERRLRAIGQADLGLVLYNPASSRRTWQLPRAREILLEYRRPETPVGIVERAFRPGTRVRTTTLADLALDGVVMETTVIVGSSTTRLINGRMVTPRGYGAKS